MYAKRDLWTIRMFISIEVILRNERCVWSGPWIARVNDRLMHESSTAPALVVSPSRILVRAELSLTLRQVALRPRHADYFNRL